MKLEMIFDKAEEQTDIKPVNELRICVSKDPYTQFVSLYRSGEVVMWSRADTQGKSMGHVYDLDAFNEILVEQGFEPYGYGKGAK